MEDDKGIILTVETEGEGLYKEKGSKFLSFIYKVTTEEDIKEKLTKLRKKYYDARHYCYAYVIGQNKEIYKANDDGEPKNSAGMPILGQIRSYNLNNILVVVVRYFGGTKLGVGGLVKAYKTATKDAIQNSKLIEEIIKIDMLIKFQYIIMNKVMKVIKKYDIEVKEQKSDIDCEMTLSIPLKSKTLLQGYFNNIEGLEMWERK